MDESGTVVEGLPTLTALVGLLPRVTPHVSSYGVAVTEGFPTFFALKGLFSGVNLLVPCEVRPEAEGLPALTALIGPLTMWITGVPRGVTCG